jgi:hypothetical protein
VLRASIYAVATDSEALKKVGTLSKVVEDGDAAAGREQGCQ